MIAGCGCRLLLFLVFLSPGMQDQYLSSVNYMSVSTSSVPIYNLLCIVSLIIYYLSFIYHLSKCLHSNSYFVWIYVLHKQSDVSETCSSQIALCFETYPCWYIKFWLIYFNTCKWSFHIRTSIGLKEFFPHEDQGVWVIFTQMRRQLKSHPHFFVDLRKSFSRVHS